MIRKSYRGTSFIRNSAPWEAYSRTTPGVLWWSYRGGAVSYQRGHPVQTRKGVSLLHGQNAVLSFMVRTPIF